MNDYALMALIYLGVFVLGLIFGGIGASAEEKKNHELTKVMMTMAIACMGLAVIGWVKLLIAYIF